MAAEQSSGNGISTFVYKKTTLLEICLNQTGNPSHPPNYNDYNKAAQTDSMFTKPGKLEQYLEIFLHGILLPRETVRTVTLS
jgi:hypothetical protein